jgi:aspartate racemase
MKCLGLLGCQHTGVAAVYWQTMDNQVRLTLGAHHTARVLINGFNAAELDDGLHRENWRAVADNLIAASQGLAVAGADGLVICGSSLNPLAEDVGRAVALPVVNLGLAMAERLRHFRVRRVGILGVRTVPEEKMWREKLSGIEIVDPLPKDRVWLNECVDRAMTMETAPDSWRIETNRIVSSLRKSGAQAVILAANSIGRWLTHDESSLPLFDAAEIHAWVAAEWALAQRFDPAPPCVSVTA